MCELIYTCIHLMWIVGMFARLRGRAIPLCENTHTLSVRIDSLLH